MTAENESLNPNSIPSQTGDNSDAAVDSGTSEQGETSTGKLSTGRGGARPGAGRPKGTIEPQTIEKLAIKRQFEDRVARHAQELFNAQITVAKGTQYIIKRTRVKTQKGYRWTKFEIVTDPEEIVGFLDGDFNSDENQFYMITADKPDMHAIDSLLDRAFGKAPQNLNIKDDRPDPIGMILKRFGLLEEEGTSTDDTETESTA